MVPPQPAEIVCLIEAHGLPLAGAGRTPEEMVVGLSASDPTGFQDDDV